VAESTVDNSADKLKRTRLPRSLHCADTGESTTTSNKSWQFVCRSRWHDYQGNKQINKFWQAHHVQKAAKNKKKNFGAI
jgi:hypothetical protein